MKRCPRCSQTKPHSEFDKNITRSDGLHSWCKPCRVESARAAHLRHKYNITLDEYLQLFEKQNGLCAICDEPETRMARGGGIMMLSVDHCHVTGNIRSLLCDNCNNGLGRFRDNVKILQKAITYLSEHQGEGVIM